MIAQPDDVLWPRPVSQHPPPVFPVLSGVISEPPSPQHLRLLQPRVSVGVGLRWRNVVLVILSLRPHVVNDGSELPLAERANCLHFGPLQEAGEAELVAAGVSHGLVVQLPQADGAQLVPVRRGRASIKGLGSPLAGLLVIFPSGGAGGWGRSFGS